MADEITIETTSQEVIEVGTPGPQGATGQGVPVGGTTGQVLRKASGTNYDTEWAAAGSGSGSVTSVALAGTGLSISGSPITTSGTITANVSYGTTAGTATQGNDSRIANIAANSITTAQGANSGGSGGTITMRGGVTGSNGAGGNAGSINLRGSDDREEGTFNGGSIDLSGVSGNGGNITSTGGSEYAGGSLNMSSGSNGAGGSINTSNAGGSVNTSAEGGTINTSAAGGSINTSDQGGSINTSNDGGSINTSGFEGYDGGDINTSAGEETAGGSINTSSGGGSINTTGTGSIGFGTQGTRTTLVGTATEDRAISLPDKSGKIVLQNTSTGTIEPTPIVSSAQRMGSIDLGGDAFGDYRGGLIVMRGDGADGGTLNLSDGGGSVNTSLYGGSILTYGVDAGTILSGGSIITYGGGGSINTRGTGSIGFGESGTRTTLTGTATAARAISLPNAGGTLALTQQATDYEVTDETKGVIMKSPNGTRWRLTIDNSGTLLRTALALIASAFLMCGAQAQVRDLVYGTNNVVIGPTNTNALTFTNSVSLPISSGAATTNSILTADGAGGSAFVVSRTVTRFTTNDQTKTNWTFIFGTQATNNDAQMGSWALDANSFYRVEYAVAWVATTNSGFNHALGFSTNLSEFNHRTGVGQAANGTVTAITTGTNVALISLPGGTAAGTGARYAVAGFVYLLTSSNANTMNYRWYPISNVADATTLVRSSMVSVTKMAP